MTFRYRVPTLLVLLVLGLTACGVENGPEEGVVAKVNGEPIRLETLEAEYDRLHLFQSDGLAPTVEKLRERYGEILTDLVVDTLVAQELARLQMAVTDEELAVAEAEVRADYPDDTFEQTLVEQYIDIELWRRGMRARLAREKFMAKVLRPTITIGYQDAQAYYKEHLQEFYLPRRYRFQLVAGPTRKLVEQALAAIEKDGAAASSLPGVTVQELKMGEDRLPLSWREVLGKLKPGAAGFVSLAGQDGNDAGQGQETSALKLLEVMEARLLEPSQAYPIVERILLEQELEAAFSRWVEGAVQSSVIEVSAHLLPQEEPNGDGEPNLGQLPPEDDTGEALEAEPDAEPQAEPHDETQDETGGQTAGDGPATQ